MRVCSGVESTEVLYDGRWVPAFHFNFDAFSFPGAYARAIRGSEWIGPIPTASIRASAGTTHFRAAFRLPDHDGDRTRPLLTDGVIHADNSATIFLNDMHIFQHPAVGDPANFTGSPETFAAESGFVGGINTVAFDLWNDPFEGPNPAGLDFCFTVRYTRMPR